MLAILVAALAGLVGLVYLFLKPRTAPLAAAPEPDEANDEQPGEVKEKKTHRGGSKAKGAQQKGRGPAPSHKPKVVAPPPHPLLIKELKGHSETVTSVAFSPDGRFVATASEDGSIRLIHADTLEDPAPKFYRINISFDHATAVAFSDNSKRLVAVTANFRKCCFFSVPSEAEVKKGAKPQQLKEFETGHSQPVMEVFLLDVEKWMVVVTCGGGSDTMINLFNIKGERMAQLDTGHIKNNVACSSPDNRFVGVGCYVPEVGLLEVCRQKTGEFDKLAKAMTLGGHKGQIVGVAISPDSTRALTASLDGTWRTWDITVRYNLDEDPRCKGTYSLDPAKGVPSAIAFGPGGKVVAIAAGKRLLFCSADTGEQLAEVEDACGTGAIIALRAPGDSRMVAAIASDNKHTCVWRFPPC